MKPEPYQGKMLQIFLGGLLTKEQIDLDRSFIFVPLACNHMQSIASLPTKPYTLNPEGISLFFAFLHSLPTTKRNANLGCLGHCRKGLGICTALTPSKEDNSMF